MRESGLFGTNPADKHEYLIEEGEADEPKAATPDRFQQNQIPYKVKDPEPPVIKQANFEKRHSMMSRVSLVRRPSKLMMSPSFNMKDKANPFKDEPMEKNVWEKDRIAALAAAAKEKEVKNSMIVEKSEIKSNSLGSTIHRKSVLVRTQSALGSSFGEYSK